MHLGYYFYDVICFDAQVKCEMYWPDVVREPKQYGEVVVNPISISQIDKYNINIFQVSVVRTPSVINFFFLFKMFFLYCSKIVSLYKSRYKQNWISLPGSRKVQLLVWKKSFALYKEGTFLFFFFVHFFLAFDIRKGWVKV